MKHTLPTHAGWMLLLTVAGVLPAFTAVAAEADMLALGPDWQRAITNQVDLHWTDTPLREGLARLSRLHRVAVVVDRRLDPDQTPQFNVTGAPLADALVQLAAQLGGGFTWLGPVGYIGPRTQAVRLGTLSELRAEDARQLSKPQSARWLTPRPFAWQELDEPRAIIEALAREGGARIVGLEQIEHDLWPEVELPAMSLADRMTLVLGQFDRTFQLSVDGQSLAIVPIPDPLYIERAYPAGASAAGTVERFRQLTPGSVIATRGGEIVVRGSRDDHARLAGQSSTAAPATSSTASAQSPAGRPAPKGDTQVHSLRLREIPLSHVIPGIAKRLSLQVKMDEAALAAAGISLDRMVTFEVERVTTEQLWDTILRPAGLAFKITGQTIEITPAKK